MIRPPPISPLFPYTTLFRSSRTRTQSADVENGIISRSEQIGENERDVTILKTRDICWAESPVVVSENVGNGSAIIRVNHDPYGCLAPILHKTHIDLISSDCVQRENSTSGE